MYIMRVKFAVQGGKKKFDVVCGGSEFGVPGSEFWVRSCCEFVRTGLFDIIFS